MKNFLTHFNTRNILIIAGLGAIMGCGSPAPVEIIFNAYVDGIPLEYGKEYPAPNEDGTYSISDFKFYVSNISLSHSGTSNESFVEEESYHLLKFSDSNSCVFILNGVSSSVYDTMRLSIGIDSVANSSINNPGDLDPTNQMAWNWTSGYKFLLLEGLYKPNGSGLTIPLVYHIGFSENEKDLIFHLPKTSRIQFAIEISELFKQPNFIDFHVLPKVLFNKADANTISLNYANSFIKLDKSGNK